MRFSAAAPVYDSLADVQRKAAGRLMALVDNCPAPKRILEVGCGTGVLTALLSRRFPSANIDAVDISPAMIARARHNLQENGRINWIVSDVRGLLRAEPYDLIASSCVLHWVTPLEPVFERLNALLNHEGHAALALMTSGTFAELHASRKRIAPHKPPRVIMPAEDKVSEALFNAGMAVMIEKRESLRQNFSSAGELVRHLHRQGLTGGNVPSNRHALNRTELFRLIEDYDSNYRDYTGVFASYRLYCVGARKSASPAAPFNLHQRA